MADYEIIDLKEAVARVQVRPPTEAELWAQMMAGDISPALYQIRAAKLEGRPGYVRFEHVNTDGRTR